MVWLAFVIGLGLGTVCGILVIGLCRMAAQGNGIYLSQAWKPRTGDAEREI